MKEIEKYIGYYLLVYIIVLIVCGFFQYMVVCQGKSLECNFSMVGINTILTTTAYVITPIVAIIGFLSWRNQETFKKTRELLELILEKTKDLHSIWHKSREQGDYSRFQHYCMGAQLGTGTFDSLKFSKIETKKIQKIMNVFRDLSFLSDKLHIESGLDTSELDKTIDDVGTTLEQNLNDLYDFQAQLVQLKYGDNHSIKSETEMRIICDKLDFYCNQIMGREKNVQKIDYSKEIDDTIKKLSDEIIKLRKLI
ncbi:hypothetical protein AWW72_10870 [Acinetobacter sp. NRRL B-65365]|uniref:hypothetical protein n=1 Tax=Acinetobacter sp. NRRL B-65365 TaxID=1785092 RepID=UPI0007A05250|nr:hypothetical protein [Acinetobacter sp. NRRL B-65365]KYQ84068.1 hypothetical protein AWW72_10870 [Acinetobacter sp. NRRL B-65365]